MNEYNKMNKVKPLGLLSRQSGITILETMAVMTVVVVTVLAIYIGVVYAERQLLTNYRDRVATLLITGELEMEYYRHTRSKPFELQLNKQYILDDTNPEHVLCGNMTVTTRDRKSVV